ncbi:MAG: hypothetical protein HC879_01215 [Leptolyngbyaceae cyanobacterium SL_5_9]|nr:hypothetical protein [Leptolyngbyaceae cyanobacterium SL_5_9]
MQLMKSDSFNSELSKSVGKPTVNLPDSAAAMLKPDDLDTPTSEAEAWAYDEPACNWQPLRQDDQDCGDGVVCPPCN